MGNRRAAAPPKTGFDKHLLKPVALEMLKKLFRHPKLLYHRMD
jgi:hypothetical protein